MCVCVCVCVFSVQELYRHFIPLLYTHLMSHYELFAMEITVFMNSTISELYGHLVFFTLFTFNFLLCIICHVNYYTNDNLNKINNNAK